MKGPLERQPPKDKLQKVHDALYSTADPLLQADLKGIGKDLEWYLVGIHHFHDDHIILAVLCEHVKDLEKGLRALGDIYLRCQYNGGDYCYLTWYA